MPLTDGTRHDRSRDEGNCSFIRMWVPADTEVSGGTGISGGESPQCILVGGGQILRHQKTKVHPLMQR